MERIIINQEREFGSVLNVSFTFAGQNIWKILKVLLYFAGILVIAGGIIYGFIQKNNINSIKDPATHGLPANTPGLMFFSLCVLAAYVIIIISIYAYIRLYAEKGRDQIEISDIWLSIRQNFFRVLGAMILCSILTFIGFLFFIIPGIYFMVVFAIVPAAMIIEDYSFSDAFSQAFFLIKKNWWATFGIRFILGLVGAMMGYIVLLPVLLVMIFSHLTATDPSGFGTVIAIIFGLVYGIMILLTAGLQLIGTGIQYYSLVEQKEQRNLNLKVDEIKSDFFEPASNPEDHSDYLPKE